MKKLILLTFCSINVAHAMEHNNPLYEAETSPRKIPYILDYQNTIKEYPGLEYFAKAPIELRHWNAGNNLLHKLFVTAPLKPGWHRATINKNNTNNDPNPAVCHIVKSKDLYLQEIVQLYWALYKIACEKPSVGYLFDKGSITIEDPELKIYNFLLNYPLLVDPTLTGTDDSPKIITINPDATPRKSTHYKESQKLHTQYGIDIRFDDPQLTDLFRLPHNHLHILFGIVSKARNLIFIKIEDAGLYAFDGFFSHAGGLLKSTVRRSLYMIKPLVSEERYKQYQDKVGKDDDPDARREKIPGEALKEFSDIINNSTLSAEKKQQHIARFKELGLQYAYNMSKPPSTIAPGTKTTFPYQGILAFFKKYAVVDDENNPPTDLGKWREVKISKADLLKAIQ